MRFRPSRLVALAPALLALMLPSLAGASTTPMSYSALSPDDGTQHLASSWPYASDGEMIDFTVTATPPAQVTQMTLEVSTQNVPGQDGTLANDYQVAYELLSRSDAYPDHWSYRTQTFESWLSKPGTYYWQIYYTTYDCSQSCQQVITATPVRSLVINPKPVVPPPSTTPTGSGPTSTVSYYSIRQAKADMPSVIESRLNRAPHGLKIRRCSHGDDDLTVLCADVSWYDRRYVYAGGLGEALSDDGGTVFFAYGGLRATRKCMAHHSARHCARHYKFSGSY
jgi:hypothetical protein